MSAIKRWIDDEVERLAKEYNKPWDIVMDALIDCEYDWELLERLLMENKI